MPVHGGCRRGVPEGRLPDRLRSPPRGGLDNVLSRSPGWLSRSSCRSVKSQEVQCPSSGRSIVSLRRSGRLLRYPGVVWPSESPVSPLARFGPPHRRAQECRSCSRCGRHRASRHLEGGRREGWSRSCEGCACGGAQAGPRRSRARRLALDAGGDLARRGQAPFGSRRSAASSRRSFTSGARAPRPARSPPA